MTFKLTNLEVLGYTAFNTEAKGQATNSLYQPSHLPLPLIQTVPYRYLISEIRLLHLLRLANTK
jgi:hypothetical protein